MRRTLPLSAGLALIGVGLCTVCAEPWQLYRTGDSWRGAWLRNDHIEVFVTTSPGVRLLHLSVPGGKNMLRSLDDDVSGIKTGYLEPGHRPDSFNISEKTAEVTSIDDRRISLLTGTDPSSRLGLRWEVKLAEDAPEALIRHELTNHARITRTLGVWSLMAVDAGGRVRADGVAQVYPLDGQPLGTAAQVFEKGDYILDLDAPIHPYILRTGLLCPEPGFTYRNAEGTLRSIVPEHDGPWSPPGINLLFYADVSPQERFAELEHLGPLQTVGPGESITLVQTIRLSPRKSPDSAEPSEAAGQPERSPPPIDGAFLRLAYGPEQGIEARADGEVLAWTAPLQGVPVSLRPLDANRPPEAVGKALLFAGSPLEIPRLAPLQAVGPDAPRAVEIAFHPKDRPGKVPQMLIEIGGSGNGYNLWLQDGQLHAGVWGKNDAGEVTAEFMQVSLPPGQTTAGLKILPANQLAELWLNGSKVAEAKLPSIMPHRDRCALGGVAGTSRLRTGVVKAGAAPLKGQVSALNIQWGAAEQSSN